MKNKLLFISALFIYFFIVIYKSFKKVENFNVIIPSFLELKRSDNMGDGLFAKEKIDAYSSIGVYRGNIISDSELNHKIKILPITQKYAFNVGPNKNVDAIDYNGNLKKECYLAKVNEPPKGTMENLIALKSKNSKIYFVSIKDILPGEQLFVSYGDKYERDYTTNEKMTYPHWIVDAIDNIIKKYPNLQKPDIKFV